MRHVIVVEDDAATNDRLKELLEAIQMITVVQTFDRTTAEGVINSTHLDLAIVDIDLGHGPKDKYAGFTLLADLSKKGCTTIVVSGMPEENLKEVSLSLNAYDFIGKPITDLDFINKVEHALAWETSEAGMGPVAVHAWPEGLAPDLSRKPTLLWKGRAVRLTLTELCIVHCLVESPGHVVEYNRLAKSMKSSASSKALATHMTGVRRKFIDVDPSFDRIDSEPGKGYVWKTGS